jgi:L-fuculose-phosphate aldolase
MKDLENLRKELIETCLKLKKKDLTHGTCGNISCKITGEKKILITPSRLPYEKIKPEDILVLDLEGKVIVGNRVPSVETPFHLAVYKNRTDVGAVIHTHSMYTLSVSSTAEKIPVFLDEVFSHIGGELEVSPYAIPGSDDLANNMIKHLKDKSAVLLSNHGSVCCGKNLEDAFNVVEVVEKICKMFILASVLGEVKSLPEGGIKYQREMYENKKNF